VDGANNIATHTTHLLLDVSMYKTIAISKRMNCIFKKLKTKQKNYLLWAGGFLAGWLNTCTMYSVPQSKTGNRGGYKEWGLSRNSGGRWRGGGR
jgi:hypothetical protein